MRHTNTLFTLQLPDGRILTIEEDFTNGRTEGIIVCLAEVGDGEGEFGDTISRDPVWEPEEEEE